MAVALKPDELAVALVILIAFFTVPSVRTLVKKSWWTQPPKYENDLYEDADGVATKESMAQFSNKTQFIFIFIFALVGLAIAIADAIFTAVREGFNFQRSGVPLVAIWMLAPAWIFLLLQFIVTAREVNPVARFESAISRLITCFLTLGLAAIALLGDYNHGQHFRGRVLVTSIMTGAQLLVLLGLVATILSVRRRPAVFSQDGKVIETQNNANLWARYTFQWCIEMFAKASKDTFGNSDLPALDHVTRSEGALAKFHNIIFKEDSLPLWARILWVFRTKFLFQWTAILISNLFDVAPTFVTLLLLQSLEERDDPTALDPMDWIYVVGIVTVAVASHIIDSRIDWLSASEIIIPLRSTLTALMYTKMMEKQDSNEPHREDNPSKEDGSSSDGVKQPDEKSSKGSQQDIVTLFAVDCEAIAVFGRENSEYVNTAGKLLVTVVFLLHLIGWQSLCAGMVAIAILFPINKSLGERYGKKQKLLMKARDKKTITITEALQGIRQIKFSALEKQWTEKLEEVRENELSMLWKTRVINMYMSVASEFTPVLLTAFSLTTYSLINGRLLPSVAFTAISLFLELHGIVAFIPYLMVAAINAKVSCDRIDAFLRSPNKPEIVHPGESIAFQKASVTFPSDFEDPAEDRFTLRDLDLQFPNEALSVISGPTGSGKSLLLAAILGEVRLLSGYIQVPKATEQRFDSNATAADWIIPSSISFVSQIPWIENATIRDNILFGLPYDPIRYQKVLNACALSQDLRIFEDGDQTEVGAQGISLSGGQKWRLTLARAFYSRAGIIIMDDVFSALDAHVGRHIYESAIMGELSTGRTRILVTHHVSLCLPRAKYAVRLSASGVVEHAGLIEELRQTGSLDEILKAEDDIWEPQELENVELPDVTDDSALTAKLAPKKLIEEEKRETGRVKTSVYAQYLQASGGWPFWVFLTFLYLLTEGLTFGRTYWVKIWANGYDGPKVETSLSTYHYQYNMQTQLLSLPSNDSILFKGSSAETQDQNLWFYLGIYMLISTLSVAISIARLYNIYTGSIQASRKVFNDILYSVLRAKSRWLDTVPTGRILNRFTGDFVSLDANLASNFYYLASAIWELLSILVAALFVSPLILLFAAGLLAACSLVGIKYIAAARGVKRLESTSKSPVISYFSASLSGLSTIRAYSKVPEFRTRMLTLIDTYAVCSWYNSLFRDWLRIFIGSISSLFAGAVGALIITTPGIDVSLAGFSLSFALNFGYSVMRAISVSTQMELNMNAVERIFEYRDLDIEEQEGDNIRASWPENGRIEVKGLEVGYAEGLPSILKGLTFIAEPTQRVGVIGRTGAGKSTLSLAIFRFLEARKGTITIDDVDISKIKMHDLRTRLAIIPQDPILFSGTIRSNLDPFDQFSDAQLREALMRVHLIPSGTESPVPEATRPTESSATSSTVVEQVKNKNLFLSFTSPIASGGSNLSHGQKQLLCLARAILSRPKILVLDEATSAVDMATDLLIQRSIREEFANTTLLVVAHRLSTVADFDRLVVMKDGAAAEVGSPKELLGMEDGLFKGMVAQSGEKEELEKMIMEN